MSWLRVWRNMNSRSGSSPRLIAVESLIWPLLAGSQASFLIVEIVGAITNRVRNSAIPTSTWLGGVRLGADR